MTTPPSVPSPAPTTGRPSALEPAITLERRVPPFFTFLFYGFPALAAWVLLYNSEPGASARLWRIGDPERAAVAAAGLLGFLFTARAVALRSLRAARALESEFGWIVGRQKKWECFLLGLMSGAAEEYLFRGWLQLSLGLGLASLAFAVLHWPVNRNFLLWPFFALAAGLLFGWSTQWTGSLIPAALAHGVYNTVALLAVSRRFYDWDQEKVDRYIEGSHGLDRSSPEGAA